MGCAIQRALLIACVGAALGLAANAVSPRGIPFVAPPKVVVPPSDFIPLHEAKQLWQSGTAYFLDARAPADYVAGHIASAFNLPADEFDTHYAAVASMLTTGSVIVAYCDGVECDLSHDLTKRLRQLDYKNVRILKNGWTVWRGAGLA